MAADWETVKALAEYLGHSDRGFTLRTYTHLMPASAARTRDSGHAEFPAGGQLLGRQLAANSHLVSLRGLCVWR